MRKVVYIAGPITNVDRYWEAFEKAENELRARGFTTLSPATLPRGMGNDRYMRICFAMIDSADAVLMLPGWRNSDGATIERAYCLYTEKPVRTCVEALEEVLR